MGGLALKILGFFLSKPVMTTGLVAGAGLAIPATRDATKETIAAVGAKGVEFAKEGGSALLSGALGGGTNPDGSEGFSIFNFLKNNWGMAAGAGAGLLMGDGIFGKLFMAVALGFAGKFVGDMLKGGFNHAAADTDNAPAPANNATVKRDATDLSGLDTNNLVGQSGDDHHQDLPQPEGPELEHDNV